MNLLPIFRAIRTRLQPLGPVYRYLGQYLPGKDNTSYRVPAIYIELPKPGQVKHYPGGIRSLRDEVTIHVITNHVYKNGEGAAADAADDAHQALVQQVQALMEGWHASTNEGARLLSQQFIPANCELNTHESMHIISKIRYQSELYDYPVP